MAWSWGQVAEVEIAELIVLGIAQDAGAPQLGCTAACCVAMRRAGRVEQPVSLGIYDPDSGQLALIEATPAIGDQIAALHRISGQARPPRQPIDALLITHAHMGHYLGLAHLGMEGAAVEDLPLYVSERLGAYLQGNGPWSQLVRQGNVSLRTVVSHRPFTPMTNVIVTPVPVPHRDEFADTMAFRIQGPQSTVLFVPDVDPWMRHPGLLESLLDGVDVAYVDGTFWDDGELPDRSMDAIGHPTMVDTMERLADRTQRSPGSIRFIHLNHTNPALWNREAQQQLRTAGFRLAQAGESLQL